MPEKVRAGQFLLLLTNDVIYANIDCSVCFRTLNPTNQKTQYNMEVCHEVRHLFDDSIGYRM